jgi:hypothetical protein
MVSVGSDPAAIVPDLAPATIARFACAVVFRGFAATFICFAVSAMRFSSGD